MKNFFYRSIFGRIYLEFLLFWDNIKPRKRTQLTPGEVSQIIRQYSLLGEGVKTLKRNINSMMAVKSKEEYHKVLTETEDLALKAQLSDSDPKAKIVNELKSKMDFSTKDIKTDTDYAKMLNQRINDYQNLHAHIAKRNAIREARKQKNGK